MVDLSPVSVNTSREAVKEALSWPEAAPSVHTGRSLTPEVERLIVLVPDQDVDEAQFAQKIWAMVSGKQIAVLFVTLLANGTYESQARRRLTTLAALSADRCCHLETRVVYGSDWVTALSPIYQEGDLIVCHEGQLDGVVNGERKQLSEALTKGFIAPVFILNGLYERINPRKPTTFYQVGYWLALGLVLAVFFGLEIGIDRISTGWVNHTLSMLAFLFEVIMIWVWYRVGK